MLHAWYLVISFVCFILQNMVTIDAREKVKKIYLDNDWEWIETKSTTGKKIALLLNLIFFCYCPIIHLFTCFGLVWMYDKVVEETVRKVLLKKGRL